MKNNCVQCHRELSGIYKKIKPTLANMRAGIVPITIQNDRIKDDKFGLCGYPDCPNFALIAIGTKQLDQMEWLKKPLGYRSDSEYLSYLRKIGLPSLAKLLKITHK